MSTILVEGQVFDFIYLYQFLKRLIIPFDKTDAFNLGIIDKDGNNLIPRSALKTTEQKEAYSYFNVMIFNLKKLLGKIPGGKTVLGSLAASLLLLKEESNRTYHIIQESDESLLTEDFINIYEALLRTSLNESQMKSIKDFIVNEKLIILKETENTTAVPTVNIPTATPQAWRRRTRLNPIVRRPKIVGSILMPEEKKTYKKLVTDLRKK